MKIFGRISAALFSLCLLTWLSLLGLCVRASAEGGEAVFVEGRTKWNYITMTADEYESFTDEWFSPDYKISTDWRKSVPPFGDRLGECRTTWKDKRHVILLRTVFEVDDIASAREDGYYMNIFYDNTITVYLNGNEVYSDGGWVDDYTEIPLDNFGEYLVEGENVLAVSLVDDVGGREFDMGLYTAESEEERLARLSVSEDELKSTGLSTVYIDTDDGDYVQTRLEYSGAKMRIALSDEFADFTNVYTTESGGRIILRGRGNSTWNNGYPDGKQNTLPGDTHTRKVSYTVKLDAKTELFGMGRSKKWVLNANYMDRTNLRNKLIYDLSGRMGMDYTKSVFVNLVFNGEYMGVYALCEKISPDIFGGAVTDWGDAAEDFAENLGRELGYNKEEKAALEEELSSDYNWLTEEEYMGHEVEDYVDLSEYPLYTGWLIEYDGYQDEDSYFETAHGVPLKVSNMEAVKTNPTLFSYIEGFFNDFEEACWSDDFYNSKGKHYSDYIDVDSFVDYYILNAVMLNVEFGYKSMYMYINADGKIVLGPCWDYDWSSGNPFLRSNGEYDKWYNDGRAANNKWYKQLYRDPYFISLVRERWFTLVDAIDEMVDSVDFWRDYLAPSAELEYRKFSADEYEWDFGWRNEGRTFADECAQLKAFLKNRVRWMNEQFLLREPNIEFMKIKTSKSVNLTLSGDVKEDGEQSLFDYKTDVGGLKLTLSTEKAGAAKLYLNGILQDSKNITEGDSVEFDVDSSALVPGVNVLTAGVEVDGKLYKNYVTVVAPGEKYTSPEAGTFVGGYPRAAAAEAEAEDYINKEENSEIPEAPAVKKSYTGVVIIIASAVLAAAVGFGIGFVYQKKKNG